MENRNPYDIDNIVIENNHSLKAEPNLEEEAGETEANYHRPYSCGYVSRMLMKNLTKNLFWSLSRIESSSKYLKTEKDKEEHRLASEYQAFIMRNLNNLKQELWDVSSEGTSISEKREALQRAKEKRGWL